MIYREGHKRHAIKREKQRAFLERKGHASTVRPFIYGYLDLDRIGCGHGIRECHGATKNSRKNKRYYAKASRKYIRNLDSKFVSTQYIRKIYCIDFV